MKNKWFFIHEFIWMFFFVVVLLRCVSCVPFNLLWILSIYCGLCFFFWLTIMLNYFITSMISVANRLKFLYSFHSTEFLLIQILIFFLLDTCVNKDILVQKKHLKIEIQVSFAKWTWRNKVKNVVKIVESVRQTANGKWFCFLFARASCCLCFQCNVHTSSICIH